MKNLKIMKITKRNMNKIGIMKLMIRIMMMKKPIMMKKLIIKNMNNPYHRNKIKMLG